MTKPKDAVCIGRDPFARMDIVRRAAGSGTCDWCGQKRKTLFEYGTWGDGLSERPAYLRGRFCSKGCMKAYHDVDW